MSFPEEFEVDFRVGDITSLDCVEAIACNVGRNLGLNYKLGQAIVRAAGHMVVEELAALSAANAGMFNLGHAVSTGPGLLAELGVQRLIFVVWWGHDNDYDRNHIQRCFQAVVRQADHHKLRSLAMPVIGLGGGVQPETLAEVFATSINEFEELRHEFSLEHLIIISDRGEAMARIERTMLRLLDVG